MITEQDQKDARLARWMLANCKIVYFGTSYPIEHNLAASKNSEAFLRASMEPEDPAQAKLGLD